MSDLATPQPSEASGMLRIGVVAALLLLLLGFISIVWTPYPIGSLDVGATMQDPSAAHWLGTDQLGRDVLSLVMKGVLTSFVVSGVGVAIGALLGVPLGLAAFAWGRPADLVLRGLGGYLATVPVLVAAIVFAALLGPSAATLMIAIGIANVPALAIATRDGLRPVRTLGYAEFARLAGSSTLDIVRRHMMPGFARLLLAQAALQLAAGVLAEAGLSFVGIGTQAPATSLGLLLHDASSFAAIKPGPMLAPGLAIVLIVLALNAIGGGLRKTVLPQLRATEAGNDAA